MTQFTSPEADYLQMLRSRVIAAIRGGQSDFQRVLEQCEGADPTQVYSLHAELTGGLAQGANGSDYSNAETPAVFRRLPAPDPCRSQWWFAASGLKYLSSLVSREITSDSKARILCLGAPTLSAELASEGRHVTALDIDQHVLDALVLGEMCETKQYDAANPLESGAVSTFDFAVTDPPWYPSAIRRFINCCLQAIKVGGEIWCTFPPRLTRPGIEDELSRLAKDIIGAGHLLLGIEHGTVAYGVPHFEHSALSGLPGFVGIPWRTGDLIHLRKETDNTLQDDGLPADPYSVFARNPSEFRVFLRGTSSAGSIAIVKRLVEYATSVSTRAYKGPPPDIWTSEKTAILVGDAELARVVLAAWQSGLSIDQTREELVRKGLNHDIADEIIKRIDEYLSLWKTFAAPPPLRTEKEILSAKKSMLHAFATSETARERTEGSDSFRIQFQRDRDRIVWSAAFRRLSNKTQLFPVQHDDDLRQRLTHSIEVSQLASTIGVSLGLDTDLIGAGGLAHDIGHTPFGHAGEHALHKMLNNINHQLGGFNHYEHGVDVLRYLEGPYYVSPATSFFGLNLTPEVMECVIKHTYCHNGDQFSSEEILARSKHKDIIQLGHCHLEGQAVRVADKISYLVSDVEDGIKLGVLTQQHLLRCRFFHRHPLDFASASHSSLLERFLQQRRWILKLFMEDVIQASSKRLARLGGTSIANIRNAGHYIIQQSDDFLVDMGEIWCTLQRGRLHGDRRVVAANLHASRIVTELTLACAMIPGLIEEKFRLEHSRLHGSKYLTYYRERVGDSVTIRSELLAFLPTHSIMGTDIAIGDNVDVNVEDVIMAKDYVAALTDSRARSMYGRVIRNDESI